MDQENITRSIIALGEWLATPSGQYVRAWEEQRLAQLTTDIFGFNALQVSVPQIDALAANRMPHKFVSDSHLVMPAPGEKQKVCILHELSDLPFASQSLDLVVLPHVLEFAAEPHQILREVERVLMPEGQLIICGFNPASLWGMRQVAARLTGVHFLPQHSDFLTVLRIKDWVELLNMHVTRGHFGCYVPPFTSEKWLQRWAFMEKAGDRWWPYFGAIYILQATKRVKGMRLIGPAWSKSPLTVGNGVTISNYYPGQPQ